MPTHTAIYYWLVSRGPLNAVFCSSSPNQSIPMANTLKKQWNIERKSRERLVKRPNELSRVYKQQPCPKDREVRKRHTALRITQLPRRILLLVFRFIKLDPCRFARVVEDPTTGMRSLDCDHSYFWLSMVLVDLARFSRQYNGSSNRWQSHNYTLRSHHWIAYWCRRSRLETHSDASWSWRFRMPGDSSIHINDPRRVLH